MRVVHDTIGIPITGARHLLNLSRNEIRTHRQSRTGLTGLAGMPLMALSFCGCFTGAAQAWPMHEHRTPRRSLCLSATPVFLLFASYRARTISPWHLLHLSGRPLTSINKALHCGLQHLSHDLRASVRCKPDAARRDGRVSCSPSIFARPSVANRTRPEEMVACQGRSCSPLTAGTHRGTKPTPAQSRP